MSSVVLAGAARVILLNLCVAQGIKHTSQIIEMRTGHSAREINDLVSTSYNGAKHANKDPMTDIEFSAGNVEALFALAASDLQLLQPKFTFHLEDIFSFVTSFPKDPLGR